MVIATQNPIEQQGVYPLPEAQLDRFLFKHLMGYPTAEEEKRIVAGHGARFGAPRPEDWGIEPSVDHAQLAEAIAAVEAIPMVGDVVDYVVALVRATREAPDLEGGASPRAAAMLAGAARARAALDGARLCHARRRQGAGAGGAAPPRHPFRRGRDRGPAGRERDRSG